MPLVQPITPCLWFDSQAEEAVSLQVICETQEKIDVAQLRRAFAAWRRAGDGTP